MKKNIAVIGCGYWGKNLVRNFFELGVLAAVCDPDDKLANFYAKEYKVHNLSFNDILNDSSIEGIVLAVPAPLHASMAIDAMKACKHVFVEKPLAMNSAQAEDMISISKENEVQLMVGHLLQYHPIFITLRDLVDAKALGSIDYIYSNRLSLGKIRTEEDVVWSFAPHDISMILALAGAEPKEIRTESSSIVQRHIADTATIHMKFESNLRAHISVSWLHPFKEQKLVVIGKKAMAVFDDTKPWDEKLAIYKHEVSINDENPVLNKSDVEYIKVLKAEPLRNECQHFLDVVGNNCVPLTNSSEGLSVLRVLTASHLSAESGEPIKLEIL